MTLFGKVLPDIRTTWQHVRTLPSVPEYFESPLRMRKRVIALTVQTLGQAIRTLSCFGKNYAILKKGSQKTVQMQLSDRPDATCQSPNLIRIRFSISL
jgi:hypothetical protein